MLDEPLADLPYADRLSRVRTRRVAIWDTIVACERAGSLDAAIRNAEQGEIARVRRVYGLDRRYVVSVGTLEPRKNLPTLLRAFDRLRARAGTPTAELLVCTLETALSR